MPRLFDIPVFAAAFGVIWAASGGAQALELPSFLQTGDAFCTNQADYDDYAAHGRVRPNSAIETCVQIDKPTRVAIIGGKGGAKSMVRVINGPYAYAIGWTNGKLPLVSGGK
jgi:hypothetical protein